MLLGARFDFELAEELKEAAFDEEVKTALANKISRERIGHEAFSFSVFSSHIKFSVAHNFFPSRYRFRDLAICIFFLFFCFFNFFLFFRLT